MQISMKAAAAAMKKKVCNLVAQCPCTKNEAHKGKVGLKKWHTMINYKKEAAAGEAAEDSMKGCQVEH